jgi:hypothetical protein
MTKDQINQLWTESITVADFLVAIGVVKVDEEKATWRPDWSKVYDGSNRDFGVAQQLLLVTRETLALSRSSIRQCNEQDYYHNRGAAERELTALLGDGEV